jgi:uncharacterized protein GlcG (DUF336 family)
MRHPSWRLDFQLASNEASVAFCPKAHDRPCSRKRPPGRLIPTRCCQSTLSSRSAVPPLPRRDRILVGPQTPSRRFRRVLHSIQAAVSDVLVEHPRQPGAHGRHFAGLSALAAPKTHRLRASHWRNLLKKLTCELARAVIDGAFAAARAEGFKPMGVVVVDAAAQPIASVREDGATALRLDIALGKAAAAVGMGVSSRALAQRTKDVPVFLGSIPSSANQPFLAQTGAVLIVDDGGAVLGAAGASGGTGDEDEKIVIAGIEAAGLRHA